MQLEEHQSCKTHLAFNLLIENFDVTGIGYVAELPSYWIGSHRRRETGAYSMPVMYYLGSMPSTTAHHWHL